MVRTGRPACGRILSWSDWTPYAPVATALTAWQARSGRRGKAAGFTHRLAALLSGTAMVTALCRSIVKVLKTNPRRRILAWSDRGVHALSLLRFDTQTMFAPKATSCGERAKPSVSCGPAVLRVQRIGRTTEAISMRKSWKPSECDQTSSLHRLVGDFISKDHLFVDLTINHHIRSHDRSISFDCQTIIPTELFTPDSPVRRVERIKSSVRTQIPAVCRGTNLRSPDLKCVRGC